MTPYEIPDINTILPQGSDIYEFFQLFSGPGESIPFNLTDYTARCDLRTHFNAGKSLSTLTSENGGIVLGASEVNNAIRVGPVTNGGLALVYTHAMTSGIKFTGDSLILLRQIELIDKYNKVQRVITGTVTLTRESTK